MKEKTMFKIAISCSLVGLIALFLISENIAVEEIKINEIGKDEIGKEVKVIGRVESVSNGDKVAFLEVGQETVELVSVTLFEEEDIELNKGQMVELIGEVDEFGGKISIIANAVKVR